MKAAILEHVKRGSALGFVVSTIWMRKRFRFNRSHIHGLRNMIVRKRAILNGVNFDIEGHDNIIEIGRMAILENVHFHVRGSFNSVRLAPCCRVSNSSIWIEDGKCVVEIGSETTIGGMHLAATEDCSRVSIGKDCMFANDIDVRTGDSHGIYSEDGQRLNRPEDVEIGDNVWIAARAIILKGTKIGSGSVVGTGSVVTKGIYPSNCIIAGNPAVIVKSGIRWTRSRHAQLIDESLT